MHPVIARNLIVKDNGIVGKGIGVGRRAGGGDVIMSRPAADYQADSFEGLNRISRYAFRDDL
jgi:hypothetical protein